MHIHGAWTHVRAIDPNEYRQLPILISSNDINMLMKARLGSQPSDLGQEESSVENRNKITLESIEIQVISGTAESLRDGINKEATHCTG